MYAPYPFNCAYNTPMILSRIATAIRSQAWPILLTELLVLVLGVFIGLQADDWNQQRKDRSAALSYLDRIQVEIASNLAAAKAIAEGHAMRAVTLAAVYNILSGRPADWPPQEDLQYTLCRWYITPVSRATYIVFSELQATGGLSLIRDPELRAVIHNAYATHEITQHQMEMMQDTLRQFMVGLAPFIHWQLPPGFEDIPGSAPGSGSFHCEIDYDGIAADPDAMSLLAQIHRSQKSFANFRMREMEADRLALMALDER